MQALIFDLNGTMIDDMSFHTIAWQDIFNNDLKADFSLDQVKSNMYGKNSEVLERMFGLNYFTNEEITAISEEKERRYQAAYRPSLRLLPGLPEFLEAAQKNNIPMAIASAAIPFNIDFVLDGLKIRNYFSAIVSANDVQFSKPHPETFLKAASLLGVSPLNCLVLEDAPKGAEAADKAGMQCAVLTTTHEKAEFSYLSNITNFSVDYLDDYFVNLLNE